MTNSAIPPTAPIKNERSVQFIIKSQNAMVAAYSWQCCLNCDHFTKTSQRSVPDETKYSGQRLEETGPKCMKYDMTPPPDVMVVGCEEWEAGIPF